MMKIETADITERLVGIPLIYLNNFLQRRSYSLAPSVEAGKVRAKRRLFSEADVYGIALVWMLFESGLRTQTIRRILNNLAETKKANANRTAEKLRESQAENIVIVREPRGPKGPAKPEPRVQTSSSADVAGIVADNPTANVLIVPIRTKFEDIKKRLEFLF
jgi:hypothetical protein